MSGSSSKACYLCGDITPWFADERVSLKERESYRQFDRMYVYIFFFSVERVIKRIVIHGNKDDVACLQISCLFAGFISFGIHRSRTTQAI